MRHGPGYCSAFPVSDRDLFLQEAWDEFFVQGFLEHGCSQAAFPQMFFHSLLHKHFWCTLMWVSAELGTGSSAQRGSLPNSGLTLEPGQGCHVELKLSAHTCHHESAVDAFNSYPHLLTALLSENEVTMVIAESRNFLCPWLLLLI